MQLDTLKQKAIELGFNIVGVIRAEPSPYLAHYFQWIEADMHGSMGYLARPDRQIRRQDLNVILDGVQSMILVGLDYRTLEGLDALHDDPSHGRIASYAWNVDYHDVMTPRLEAFAEWLRNESGVEMQHRVYVDTGAILERSHAQQAGMGFIGKNTMLIHPRRGSYFFLGEILTTLEFDDYDNLTPSTMEREGKTEGLEGVRSTIPESMCGTCTRCLNACPTDAFPRPYVLDARRCISYLTIEHKGIIDRELRPLMGNWVYGCDVCQDVCPWNRFAVPTQEQAFYPVGVESTAPKITDLLALDEATFKARYAQSPILRIKRERMVRNACIAAGNWGDERALPHLLPLLEDPSALVRAHAVWAVWRIMGESARTQLRTLREKETDPDVLSEIDQCL